MSKIIINGNEWNLTEFISELRKFNSAYRRGEQLISDKQYDNLVEALKEQYPEHDWFWSIEPDDNVSAERKTKLPIQMKSLNKVKTIGELMSWSKSCGLRPAHKVVVMPKLDGGSLLIDEKNKKGYSRGGEENEGQNCDLHIERAGLPMCDRYQYSYGEFIISKGKWKENFEGQINPKSGEIFKAPRNVAVGMLNADVPPQSIVNASLFRFGVSGWQPEFNTFTEQITDICRTYNQPSLFYTCQVSDLTHELLERLYHEWSDYFGLDGVVVYVDNLEISEKLGRNSSSGNPLYAIAYKGGFEEEIDTPVLSITTEVSKNGYLRPTVQIEPVYLSNSTISNPTGNNMKFLVEQKITKDSIVKIIRSGEVIPKIIGVVVPATAAQLNGLLSDMSVCPSCGELTQWNDTKTDLMCVNDMCDGIRFAKIFHFFSTIGCDGLGKEIFKKLYDEGYDSVRSILNLDVESICDIDGLGVSTARLILDMNRNIKSGVDIDLLIHASDCFVGIGRKKAFQMLDKFQATNTNHLYAVDAAELVYSGVRTITEKAFIAGIKPFLAFVADNELYAKEISLTVEVNANGKYAGFNVCFTGVRDKELEECIVAEGGSVCSGVSKKTTHLIVKDLEATSNKLTKATDLGIPAFTLYFFKEKY